MRRDLGFDLNVSPRQVQVWFQNRRQRVQRAHGGPMRADSLARRFARIDAGAGWWWRGGARAQGEGCA